MYTKAMRKIKREKHGKIDDEKKRKEAEKKVEKLREKDKQELLERMREDLITEKLRLKAEIQVVKMNLEQAKLVQNEDAINKFEKLLKSYMQKLERIEKQLAKLK